MDKKYNYEKLQSPGSSPRTSSTYLSSTPNTPNTPATKTQNMNQQAIDLSMKKDVKKKLNFSIDSILSK